nr:MAG TPA: hypothetical protein [Caudoviricetes sp.]
MFFLLEFVELVDLTFATTIASFHIGLGVVLDNT